jgi:hypothetical protein
MAIRENLTRIRLFDTDRGCSVFFLRSHLPA